MGQGRTPIPNCIMSSLPLLLPANGPTYCLMRLNPAGWPPKWAARARLTAWRKHLKRKSGWPQARKGKPWSQENIFIIKNPGIFTLQLPISRARNDIFQHANVCPVSHFQWCEQWHLLECRLRTKTFPEMSEIPFPSPYPPPKPIINRHIGPVQLCVLFLTAKIC